MKIDDKQLMQIGLAALQPGMRYLIQLMEAALEEHTQMLETLLHSNGNGHVPPVKAKRVKALLDAVTVAEGKQPNGKMYTVKQLAAELKLSGSGVNKLKVKLGIERAGQRGRRGLYTAEHLRQMRESLTTPKSPVAAFWAKMTPAQRKAEMKRRTANGLGRKKAAA